MLQVPHKHDAGNRDVPVAAHGGVPDVELADIAALAAFARRNLGTILVCTVLCMAVGISYLAFSTSYYTARTTVLLDVKKPRAVQDQDAIPNNVAEIGYIESQVVVLQSALTIENTVTQLHLDDDPEFNGMLDWRASIARLCPSAAWLPCPRQPPDSAAARLRSAAEHVRQALVVQRIGTSQVIEVNFSSRNKDKAAEIANALVSSYLAGQSAAGMRLTQQAITWLEQRIEALRQQTLEAAQRLQEFKAGSGPSDPAQRAFMLRELLSALENHQTLYQGFVHRYAETAQQLSFPISDVRVLTVASPPSRPDGPSNTAILAIAALGGIVLGLMIAAAKERLDRTIHTPDQLEASTGLTCVAAMPQIPSSPRKMRSQRPAASPGEAGARLCATRPDTDALRQVVKDPGSEFSRAIGLLLSRLETRLRDTGSAVIGIAPVGHRLSHEIVASNLAMLAAGLGRKTLLIDADRHAAALTRCLAPGAACGGIDIAAKKSTIETALYTDETTGMQFLPSRFPSRPEPAEAIRFPDWIAAAISQARDNYPLIIVAMPECLESADAHYAIDALDDLVLVGQAGRLTVGQISEFFRSIRGNEKRVAGVVLSHVFDRSKRC